MAVPHSLVRVKKMLTNTPLLVDATTFNEIANYVNSRIEGNADLHPDMVSRADVEGDFKSRYIDAIKLGVMEISGPLTYRTSGWEAMCGGTSYEMLKGQMEYFVSQGAKTVAMYADSGGGQAHGMIDSANYIRKLADENGIKIVAFVDGISASACYGLTSIADEIVMTSDSQVGSIGVLIQLYNDSKALEKAGYERTFITAGADKVPFDNDGAFTQSFLDGLQAQVDELYEGFTAHVANHRAMSQDAVKGTEANVFMAKEALKLGLADSIMTAEEFNEYIGNVAASNIQGNDVSVKSILNMNSTQEVTEMATVAELTDQLAQAHATIEANANALATVTELTSKLAAATAMLEATQEKVAAMETAAAATKLEGRKAALAEVLPTDQVEAKLASYGSLDDATFSFIVGELQAAKDARAASFGPIGSENAQLTDEASDEDEGDKADAGYTALLEAGKAAAARLR
ncbi:head maturation protease [Pseudomonas phage phiPMW]|uniref:Head maturation protease n=1 Tax=Pseudomonas phage phiPMW TaxID=1815582 RepID=A0A1S5R1G4_9CAUD|nr:head maturation protease [Pseudomonas phage phiPMW]ANA49253.1 head maturation protease [Pseudomonas phage phiPMW]